MTEHKEKTKRVLSALECLTLYRNIFDDDVLCSYREILELTLKDDPAAVNQYYALIGRLLDLQKSHYLPGIDMFKNHLLDNLLCVENSFSLQCEKRELSAVDGLLVEAAKSDLGLLKIAYDFDLSCLAVGMVCGNEGLEKGGFAPAFSNLVSTGSRDAVYPEYYFMNREALKKTLNESKDWSNNLPDLHRFYRDVGSGRFARYWVFKWNNNGKETGLVGIADPDPIRMEDLVGYKEQKQEIIRNTRQFIKGVGANNLLLYGDRGTGKSSMIKSLVHLFGSDGFRLIEVSKHDLFSLQQIVTEIRGRPQRFIIFIDDLSFEAEETEYKELKSLLEGSVARPPENVRVYATSNRRNLVREFFSDREADEVGRQDTCQEKLSLADRFGIKLVFPSPDKWEYLKTVEAIAENNGIDIDRSILHDLALKWAMWQNSRSGRTARQFVDDLKGRLELGDI